MTTQDPSQEFAGSRLITAAELSATLNVPLRTLERWRRRGDGPPWCRIGPRAVRYDPVELTIWLERNRPPAVAP